MKKNLLFAAIAVLGLTMGFAQDENDSGNNDAFTQGYGEGDWTIMGVANYSTTSQADDKESTFAFMPQVGYNVSDHIQLGLNFGFMSSTQESNNMDVLDESTFMVGAYARYYCMPERRFAPFAQFGVNYMSIDDKLGDLKINGVSAGLGIGADYFLDDDWALTTSVGAISYTTEKADVSGAEAENTFGIDLDFKNVWFGVVRRF